MTAEKQISMRIPRDLWVFLKGAAVQRDTSLNKLIQEALQEFKKTFKKKA